MNKLGEYIQKLRTEAGYGSQKAFADAVGKDPSWVSRLERGVGKETPPPEDIDLLASALHVTQQDLLIAAGYSLDAPKQTDPPVVRSVRAILEGKEFTDKQIQQLATMVRGMVEMMEG